MGRVRNQANYGDPLTDIEKNTLSRIATGEFAKTIARKEGVSAGAINNRVMRAGMKLGTASQVATIIEAIRSGIIPFPPMDQMIPRVDTPGKSRNRSS